MAVGKHTHVRVHVSVCHSTPLQVKKKPVRGEKWKAVLLVYYYIIIINLLFNISLFPKETNTLTYEITALV